MTQDLKPYPAYKDSGVPWVGKVPEQWDVRRGKALFEESRLSVRDQDQIVTCFRDGQVTLRANRRTSGFMVALKEVGYQGVRHGQLVIHAMDAFAGAIGVSDSDGKCSPEYIVCNPRSSDSQPAYFATALRLAAHLNFIQVSCSAVRERAPRLRFPNFGEMLLPLPPCEEQTAIVRFLSRVDRKTQRAIQAKQKLIKLLEEQKQVLIHRYVAGQIDVRTGNPYPAYKPSGVEWLGDVPEHWEVRRLKTMCAMKSGDGITAMSIEEKGDYPVFGGNGQRGFTSKFTHDGAYVLIGRQGALCGNIHTAKGRFWASEHAVVASLYKGQVLDWFAALLEVMNLNQYSIAAAQPGLAVERVLNLWAPVPPAEVQEAIAGHLQESSKTITLGLDRIRREISLLREYRTRLVADVVTGKLDVREAAANLPAEPKAELGATEPDEDLDLPQAAEEEGSYDDAEGGA